MESWQVHSQPRQDVSMGFEEIKNLPLVNVQKLYNSGSISDRVANTYAHFWQTASPRFALRVCNCPSCQSSFSHLSFQPLVT